jgi:hypothetical protein
VSDQRSEQQGQGKATKISPKDEQIGICILSTFSAVLVAFDQISVLELVILQRGEGLEWRV